LAAHLPARRQTVLPVMRNGGLASMSILVIRSPLQVIGRLFRF
jgi:hypothetical protein